MTPESNRQTEMRIGAYTAADAILDRHQVTTRTITHEALRTLLALAYLDGYGDGGNKALDEAAEIMARSLR